MLTGEPGGAKPGGLSERAAKLELKLQRVPVTAAEGQAEA